MSIKFDGSRTHEVVESTWVNPFEEVFRLKKIVPSCACGDAQLEPTTLPVGETGTLRVRVRLDNGAENQRIRLRLVGDKDSHVQSVVVPLVIKRDVSLSHSPVLILPNIGEPGARFRVGVKHRLGAEIQAQVVEIGDDSVSEWSVDVARRGATSVVTGRLSPPIGELEGRFQLRVSVSGGDAGEHSREGSLREALVPSAEGWEPRFAPAVARLSASDDSVLLEFKLPGRSREAVEALKVLRTPRSIAAEVVRVLGRLHLRVERAGPDMRLPSGLGLIHLEYAGVPLQVPVVVSAK